MLCERAIDSSCTRFSWLTTSSLAGRPGRFGIERSGVQRYNLDSARYAKLHTGHHTSAGVDWLIIDMEHGPIDNSSAHAMIIATAGTATVPFVRLPWSHPWQAKPAMDLGALAIVFPMVCTREQAEVAVRSVRYPPAGDHLWGPFYVPMRWGQAMPQYIEAANEGMLAIITIEHPEAISSRLSLRRRPASCAARYPWEEWRVRQTKRS